ncbi:inversin protein alternative isoform, putative [Acidisarcina polymorpha]|uniref:Inversin protein alternative isoform, putative n=1 Tax=Acidisarcina polymorpha TaxID=2211140 RepID=A0A2Z5FVY9_9BACT|nr:ankyrin repeat domain-containing protein [Acidisarcina polymorpha]AXC11053.1 inversin protein alternative isoform, putative [Acidisarcina polymorpha]
MSLRELPARPNLDHLRNQARTLLRERLAAEEAATQRFTALGIESAEPRLADALHVIAQEYGFKTWPALKLHLELDSANPVEALVAAIKSNDASLVRQVLSRSPSLKAHINEPLPNYGFDEPPILSAVHKQNREMIDALLDFGANINERSRWWAGSFGVLDFASPDLSTYLISRGAAVDIHSAARLGMIGQVRELLLSDPQLVHARGGDGQLPLHFASTVEIAAVLLDHGANIDAQDIDHESTALQYMVCHHPQRHEVAKFLVSRGAQADILAASAIGDLSLVERILNDDPETVLTTVTDRYFPKRNPRSGGIIYIYGFGLTRTPHMLARQFGHHDVFEFLMQRSPVWLRLIQAAEFGDEALFQQILQKHPSLFARLKAHARRLIGTAIRNNDRAVKLLVEAGWPVNVAMDNNQTPLHYAAWHGNLAMVNVLLAHDAAVNVFESEHGGSPLAWALHGSLHGWHRSSGNYVEVALALLNAGATVPQFERPLEATEEVLEVIRQHAT